MSLKTLSLISSYKTSLASLLFINFFILGVSNLWLLNCSYSLLPCVLSPSSLLVSSSALAFAGPFEISWSFAFRDNAYTSWMNGFDINYSSIIFIRTMSEVESPSSKMSTLSAPKSIFYCPLFLKISFLDLFLPLSSSFWSKLSPDLAFNYPERISLFIILKVLSGFTPENITFFPLYAF